MSDIKVSVIVPIYNVEMYLDQCLESILKQTLHDIEIICIDDGSTDSSGKILEKYAQLDQRIRIIKKENSGYGHSMNLGLDLAKGEYIGIVESDDFVEPRMFEILYKNAIIHELDISRSKYYKYREQSCKIAEFKQVTFNKVLHIKSDLSPFVQDPSIWAAIYLRSFLNEYQIRFLETPGASFQDISFSYKTYACSKRLMITDEALIYYRVDNENASVKSKEKPFHVCDELREMNDFSSSRNIDQKIKNIIPKLQYSIYRWNYSRLKMPLRYDFLKKWSQEFKTLRKNGKIDGSHFTWKQKLNIHIIASAPWLFKYAKKIK